MIGIIGAMQLETDVICRDIVAPVTEVVADTTFVRGRLYGRDVVVGTCGPGKVFAAVTAEIMALKYQVDCIINVGVAGTLCDKLHIGDIAIATATVQHDMDTSALGDTVGMISKINVTYLPCDKQLVRLAADAAQSLGANAIEGIIATGDIFVCNDDAKNTIVGRFNAIACEMEGGAIGQVCYINKLPYLVLRAISDESDGTAPTDFMVFATDSAAKTAGLLAQLFAQM